MAQLVHRKGSPYWYARFQRGGKAYLVSTKTVKRPEARRFMAAKVREIAGVRTVDEAARATLVTMGVACPPRDDAAAVLTRQLILRADPERTTSFLAERIRLIEATVRANPAARDALADGRRRWARIIAGAQGTALRIDGAWRAWERAPRRKSASEDTVATAYLPIWDRFQKWAAGRSLVHMHDVTAADAAEYLSHLQSVNLAAKSIRNHRGFLVAVWNALRIQAGLAENVWADVPAPEATPSARRALDAGEMGRLFAAATDPEDRLAIALGFFAALRLGDVANLPWAAVNLDGGMIVFRPHKTRKYDREVQIPIHAELGTLLLAQRAALPSEEWVCPLLHRLYESGRENAGRHVCGIFTRAGIRLVGETTSRRLRAPSLGAFHALRHTFISYAARAGVPQIAVRAIVGHSNAATTRMYEHVDAVTLRTAIDAIPHSSSVATASNTRGAGKKR